LAAPLAPRRPGGPVARRYQRSCVRPIAGMSATGIRGWRSSGSCVEGAPDSREVHKPGLDVARAVLQAFSPAISVKDEPKAKPASALPFKTVTEELAFLRKSAHELVGTYAKQQDAEIADLLAIVQAGADSKKKLPGSRGSDLRDILMLLRSLEIKPAKGRRRDLKKVENLVEELRTIIDRWK